MIPRAESYKPLFWLIAIHALYFCVALYCRGFYLIDSYGYSMQADNLFAFGTWYAEDWNAPLLVDYFSIRPPLYALLIGCFRLLSDSIIPVLLVQNILSITTCWLVYSFALKMGFTSRITQRMIVLAVLFYPAQAIHANFVMTEILFQFWLTAMLITVYHFSEQPTWHKSFLLAIILSLCLLTKPVSLFIPFIVWGFMSWIVWKKQSMIRVIVPQLLVVLTFHGICLQNQHATGYYHYSSIKSINQLKYNARYTLIAARGEAYADSTVAAIMQQANTASNYGERLTIMNTAANHILVQYPVACCKVYIKGMIAFCIDPGRFDLFHFFAIEEKGTLGLMHEMQTKGITAIGDYMQRAPLAVLFLLLTSLLWNSIVVFLFLYFLFTTQNRMLRNLVFVFLAYVALATGPVGVSRYRVPVFPFILVSVLGAAEYLSKSKKTNHA